MACKEDPVSCKTNGQLNTVFYNNWTDSYFLLTGSLAAARPLAAPGLCLGLRTGIPQKKKEKKREEYKKTATPTHYNTL